MVVRTSGNTALYTSESTAYIAMWDRSIFGVTTDVEIKTAYEGKPVAHVQCFHRTDEGSFRLAYTNPEGKIVWSEWQILPYDLVSPFNPEVAFKWICDARESQCFVDLCPVEDDDYV